MDTYADDLAALVETLDLKGAIHVGHSMGGGELARYIGRHGTKSVAKAVLIGAVPPLMLKTAGNPDGLPIDAFDAIRAVVLGDRSQFFKDLSEPFYGTNSSKECRPASTASRPSPKRTLQKISRSLTCQPSSSMATTTRLFRSARRRCFPPSS
jgi:pimeloyl-ACP methyl ester carboxylesterase